MSKRILFIGAVWLVILITVYAMQRYETVPRDTVPLYIWLGAPGEVAAMVISGNPHGPMTGILGALVVVGSSWVFWMLPSLLILWIVHGVHRLTRRAK